MEVKKISSYNISTLKGDYMELKEGRIFIGRFKFKSDLLISLTDFCRQQNIKLGVFNAIGAVTNVKLGYYNQGEKKYVEAINLNKKLEISSCMGNISLKDSEVFVHAHITLSDHEGHCYGGHLMSGTIIFAAEYYIKELIGIKLERKPDPETGLILW